jgi:hypothetical protein
MPDEQARYHALLDASDGWVFKVFADWREESGQSTLAALLREASGAAVWKVSEQWVAGSEFEANVPDPRTCPKFLGVVDRTADFAHRQDAGVVPAASPVLRSRYTIRQEHFTPWPWFRSHRGILWQSGKDTW